MSKRRIAIRKFSRSRFLIKMILVILTSVTIITLVKIDVPKNGMVAAFSDFFRYASKMFFHARLSGMYSVTDLLFSLFVSLSLAGLTTLLGAVFAFVLGIAAAESLSNYYLVNSIRFLTAFIRSVPTIVWVLIFSVTVNLGAEAAVLGMSFHSTAYLVKCFSESFEQIDKKTVEALKSCGANYIEIITQAVLPSSINNLISWTFFRFEINFGNAVAVGAAAGAGGIGYELFMSGILNFNVKEVGFISYMIFFTAIILEYCSSYIRKRIRKY